MQFAHSELGDSTATIVWSLKFYDMFAFALTYKSCECQLAAAVPEALPARKQTFVYFFLLWLQTEED